MRSLVQIQDGPAGGIAQLVERCLCKANVSGSSPLTSTNFPFIGAHFLKLEKLFKFKEVRAYGGYLGIQRRRRTRLPAKRFGELETSYDPEISE